MDKKNVNKTVLVIIDGWGMSDEKKGNAVAQAVTPFYDKAILNSPYARLEASSESVGLPGGVMGNSEVGHMTIGAGRLIEQDLVRINRAFETQTFKETASFIELVQDHKKNNKKIHLLGLVSDGCVHSSEEHYLQIIQNLAAHGVDMDRVFLHAILDGRDTSPKSAQKYIKRIHECLQDHGGHLASLHGRFFAMDRDMRWERIEKSFSVLLQNSERVFEDAEKAILTSYASEIYDEFFEPCLLKHASKSNSKIGSEDIVLCFNFRSDRMRQICEAFSNPVVQKKVYAHEPKTYTLPKIYTMTEYSKAFEFPIFFKKDAMDMCLGAVLEKNALKQYRVAETEKYAHVTFFLNGGREKAFENERRDLIPSPNVKTYDEVPAMNAFKVSDHVCQAMQMGEESFIVVNFAQPDMVGHTGVFSAAIESVEATDQCLMQIHEVAMQNNYDLWVTADHGNIEQMLNEKGEVHTAHTTNKVPFIYMGDGHVDLSPEGSLGNISPTILSRMGIDLPVQMTARSLLK